MEPSPSPLDINNSRARTPTKSPKYFTNGSAGRSSLPDQLRLSETAAIDPQRIGDVAAAIFRQRDLQTTCGMLERKRVG